MIMFKSEVKLDFSSVAITHILFNLSRVSNQLGLDFVVTSGNDSNKHVHDSKHYTNQAIDVRSKTFIGDLKHNVWESLKAKMGPKFTVDLENEGKENEHFHIQVRKGISFP